MALFYYFWPQRVFIEVLWAYGQGMEDPSSPTRDQTLSPALDVVSESHSVVSNSCNPMDWSLQGSSVHGILQARILEWVAISFSRGSSRSRNRTHVSCIAGRFFTDWARREACIRRRIINHWTTSEVPPSSIIMTTLIAITLITISSWSLISLQPTLSVLFWDLYHWYRFWSVRIKTWYFIIIVYGKWFAQCGPQKSIPQGSSHSPGKWTP